MLGCEMGEYLFGMLVGFILCVVLAAATEVDGRKEAVRVGWIKIDGEIYTLRKADVVEVKSQN